MPRVSLELLAGIDDYLNLVNIDRADPDRHYLLAKHHLTHLMAHSNDEKQPGGRHFHGLKSSPAR